jgi:uncharacterized RDD family membrane protein YckC
MTGCWRSAVRTLDVRTCLFIVLSVLAFGAGRADAASDNAPVVGAAGRIAEGLLPEAHGWIVVPVTDGDPAGEDDPGARSGKPGMVLLHLPPREASLHGGVPGLGRRSRFIETAPDGIAASGRRVYLLYRGEQTEEGRTRYSVRSVAAWATAVPSNWADRPSGRMESLPALDIEGEVIGFAATDRGPAALVRSGETLSIARLVSAEWTREELTGTEADPTRDPVLLGSPRHLAVIAGGTVFLESPASVPAVKSAGTADAETQSPPRSTWNTRPISLTEHDHPIGLIGDRVIVWRTDPDHPRTVEIAAIDAQGRRPIADFEQPADAVFVGAVVMPDQNGRLVVAFGTPVTEEGRDAGMSRGPASAAIRYDLLEISLSTGDTLYSGPVDRVAPISKEEFLLVAISLIMMMVVSLVIVLRPVAGETELTIPEGCALATPGRRFAATAIDVALCTLIVSRVSGVPFGKIVGLEVLIATDRSWLTIPGVLVVGLAYATIAETVFAGTLGKLLLGCRVVRATRDGGPPRRAGFVRTLVRNGVKWILPPAASLALIEPTGRHRGDFLAESLVVVPLEPDDDDASPNLLDQGDDLNSDPARDSASDDDDD